MAAVEVELRRYRKYKTQQSMGHSNIKTTEIYLGADRRAVDELCKVVYG